MYATIAEGTAYAATSLTGTAEWEAALDDTRTRALTVASRHIDQVPLLVIETPPQQAIKDACCEEALWLLSMTVTDLERERLMAMGIVGRSAGDANEYAHQSVVLAKAQGFQGLSSPLARGMVTALKQWRVAVV